METSIITERIEKIRNEQWMTKKSFCEYLGYSFSTYGNITSNRKSKPSLELILGVLDKFPVSPEWLLLGKGKSESLSVESPSDLKEMRELLEKEIEEYEKTKFWEESPLWRLTGMEPLYRAIQLAERLVRIPLEKKDQNLIASVLNYSTRRFEMLETALRFLENQVNTGSEKKCEPETALDNAKSATESANILDHE